MADRKWQRSLWFISSGWLKQVKGQEYVSGNWTDRTQTDYTYDELGQRTARNNNDSDDILTDYVYNDRGELMSIDHEGLYEMSYTHDGGGNPMAIAFSGTNCPAVLDDKTVTYTYDEISRLTNETIPSTSNTTWTYDWIGNRNPATYTYNKVDQLTDTDGQSGVEYTYDKLGNLLYKPNLQDWEIQYIYRGDNLLSDIYYLENGNTNGVCLTWDADGHRVNVNQDFVEEWTFMYDPTAGIPAVLFSVDDDYSSPVYTYNVREPGGSLLASFEPEGANLHYYHFDALGSTVLVTNGSGTVSDTFAYDAWGNVLSTDNDTKPYQYVGSLGYYSHPSAQGSALGDLMQLGVRFYDPEIGRFTQKDPIGMAGGLNLYRYSSNNPVRSVDPSGLAAVKVAAADCNPETGIPEINGLNTYPLPTCLLSLTTNHEQQHITDLTPCCRVMAECWHKFPHAQCQAAWDRYRNDNEAYFEVRAYTLSLQEIDHYTPTANCNTHNYSFGCRSAVANQRSGFETRLNNYKSMPGSSSESPCSNYFQTDDGGVFGPANDVGMPVPLK